MGRARSARPENGRNVENAKQKSAGRRSASRGGAGVQRPPAQNSLDLEMRIVVRLGHDEAYFIQTYVFFPDFSKRFLFTYIELSN